MIKFDKQLWLNRAWARFKRAAYKGTSARRRGEAEKQWFRDVVCIEKLTLVVDWCCYRNVTVLFGKKEGGSYDSITKVITMAGRNRPEKQLYILLHECGHHLIGYDEKDERFGIGYPYCADANVNTTFHHRLACLEEEMEAWARGWRLAKRLLLNLDRSAFDVVRVDCLKSYVKWANSKALLTSV